MTRLKNELAKLFGASRRYISIYLGQFAINLCMSLKSVKGTMVLLFVGKA